MSVGVAGEARLHLRGPLEGINAITRMVHRIDQPVGQVKLGIHVLQLRGSDDAAIDDAAQRDQPTSPSCSFHDPGISATVSHGV